MTAPETIDPEGFTNMGCGCGRLYSYGGHVEPGQHDPDCPASRSLALARLQARWDARDEAERALITEWRRRVDERLQLAAESGDPDQYDGFVSGMTTAADELERAIGGGE